jgi:hypothetical protein
MHGTVVVRVPAMPKSGPTVDARFIARLPARCCYGATTVLQYRTVHAGGSNRQATTSKQTGMNTAHLTELMKLAAQQKLRRRRPSNLAS